MKWIISLLSCCLVTNFVLAQGLRKLSGTMITEEQKAYFQAHKPKLMEFNDSISRGLLEVPVKIHIVRKADGIGIISVEEVETAIRHLNDQFLPIYIHFIPLPDYNYINDDFLHTFNVSLEPDLSKNDISKVINLYIVGTIKGEKNTYCAYTYPPSNRNVDRIIIAQKCFVDKVSLIRQMGHYFSLYPTHGPDEKKNTEEFADATNCQTTGDEICDTPADPKLDGRMIDARCGYIGTLKDGKNKFYRPLTNNYMSDNPRLLCVEKFTRQQYARMLYTALNIRNYLAFPKVDLTKKQLKTLEEKYGVDGGVVVTMGGVVPPYKFDKNLYKTKDPIAAGINYEIAVTNNRKGYLYVIEGDAVRGATLLYPKQGEKQLFGDEVSQFTLKNNLVVDNNSGLNHICVLFCKKQLPIQDMLKKINAEPSNLSILQRLYKLYGNDIVSTNDIVYDPANTKVTGLTSEKTIIPILIEYDQQ